MENIRLQKYIAQCGIASRRKAEHLILNSKVKVNGKIVTALGTIVLSDDIVEVNNKVITFENKIYLLLHKPTGYVTTVSDPEGRPTVMDLVKGIKERVFPVGRLDYDTSGALIMTNDGEFANLMMHPRYNKEKVYIAKITGLPSEDAIRKLRTGVLIDLEKTAPARVKLVSREGNNSVLRISIHEGKNRQIRKMCESVGHLVKSLKRIAIGNLNLNDLPEGMIRHLTSREVNLLVADKSNLK